MSKKRRNYANFYLLGIIVISVFCNYNILFLIKFEILRLDQKTNTYFKVVVDRTLNSNEPNIFNTVENFNESMSDFYINSISVNEKNGTFDATIETDFFQRLDDRYFLSNQIWKERKWIESGKPEFIINMNPKLFGYSYKKIFTYKDIELYIIHSYNGDHRFRSASVKWIDGTLKKPKLIISGLNPHAGENGKIDDTQSWLMRQSGVKLDEKGVPPISEYDADLMLCWGIVREVTKKKSKNGKYFYTVKLIDSNSVETKIRCWGVDPDRDIVQINRPYMARLNYNQQWGFSTFSMRKMFKLLA